MSYDLVVWARCVSSLFRELFENENFRLISKNQWEFASKSWMISVSIDPVEDEDIPDNVYSLVRGITHQVSVHVMPSGAPASAMTKARRMARSLAEVGQGAVYDPQTDQLRVAKTARPKSMTADAFQEPETSHAILNLAWCMNRSHCMTPEGMNQFLDVLTLFLPEALPRRYGPYEPLRSKFSEMGRAHFVETYSNDPWTCIYCKLPAISLSLPSHDHGYRKIGAERRYWVNQVEIALDARVLDDPIWAEHASQSVHCHQSVPATVLRRSAQITRV